MTESSVAERVIRVFADFKKVSPEDIRMDTTFEDSASIRWTASISFSSSKKNSTSSFPTRRFSR